MRDVSLLILDLSQRIHHLWCTILSPKRQNSAESIDPCVGDNETGFIIEFVEFIAENDNLGGRLLDSVNLATIDKFLLPLCTT